MLFLATLAGVLLISRPVNALDRIRASGTVGDKHFYDESGRVRIFHGANRVCKGTPWFFADQTTSDDEMKRMSALGLNAVRLGYMWTGANPGPNEFNDTYIETVRSIVDRFAAYGIYTLLDMHEDILSSKFCLYDGAPRWVIDKSEPRRPFPWPLQGNCSSRGWMENALAEAVGQAYQDIYDNNHGMLDDLSAFWARSAAAFANTTGVIGYEVMNEPFAGDVYKDPLLFLPGNAGKKNLIRMYDAVASAIRAHDNNTMIFFEPVTWGMVFEGKIAGSGFDHVPGGTEYRDRSAFSYHYYCSSFDPKWPDQPAVRKVICDSTVGPLVFEAVEKDLAVFGGAQMMTEGMACGDGDMDECINVQEKLDKHLFSWTDYGDSQGATWEPSADQQATWARTYARAVAGRPLNMTFDIRSPTKDFEFCYELNLDIAAPTEVFASSALHYPGGACVRTTENVEKKSAGTNDSSDVFLFVPTTGAQPNSTACVWLSACNSTA